MFQTRHSGMRKIAIVCTAIVLVSMVGFLLGGLFVWAKPWPYAAVRIHYLSLVSELAFEAGPRVIQSKFIDLELQEFARIGDNGVDNSPMFLAGGGGGLSDGLTDGNTLLIDGHGGIYSLNAETLQIQRLEIAVPDNGRQELYAISGEEGEPRFVAYDWHRYTDIASNEGWMYIMYSHFDPLAACFTSRVARLAIGTPLADFSAGREDWEPIFVTSPCFGFKDDRFPYAGHQAGGKLALSGDGTLLISVGDYQFDGMGVPNYPQNANVDYGKLFALDLTSLDSKILSIGHRNPQGITVTPSGDIWSTEHGPEGGDELNYIVEGENYGWPSRTYGTNYGTANWPLSERQGRHDGFAGPSWAWVLSVGVSGLTYVSGFHTAWDGNLLASSIVGRSIFRIVTDGVHTVTMERIQMDEAIQDVVSHGSFLIAYTESDIEVNVYRIRALDVVPQGTRVDLILADVEPAARIELFKCLECHGRRVSSNAPNLCGVIGRPFGSEEFNYSAAMRSHGGTWDIGSLREFLEDSAALVPGTLMPNPAISDPQTLDDIASNMDFFCSTVP